MTASGTTSQTLRTVEVEREQLGRYRARNVRGGVLPIGSGEDSDFTPVELLLAAIGGCAAIDVDHITSRRADPTGFDVHISGDKVRDGQGSHLTDLSVTFDIAFPEGEAGDAARGVLQRAIDQSRDRLCTVSRTVALESPVAMAPGGVVSPG